MKKKTLIIVSIILAVVLLIGGLVIYFINTPEFALIMIALDVKDSGVDGLRQHLTRDARETLDDILAYAKGIGFIGSLLGNADAGHLNVLQEHLELVEWELRDIVKDGDRASVIVGFNYDNKLIGRVAITMLDQDGWKIDGLEWPKFEEINLAQNRDFGPDFFCIKKIPNWGFQKAFAMPSPTAAKASPV